MAPQKVKNSVSKTAIVKKERKSKGERTKNSTTPTKHKVQANVAKATKSTTDDEKLVKLKEKQARILANVERILFKKGKRKELQPSTSDADDKKDDNKDRKENVANGPTKKAKVDIAGPSQTKRSAASSKDRCSTDAEVKRQLTTNESKDYEHLKTQNGDCDRIVVESVTTTKQHKRLSKENRKSDRKKFEDDEEWQDEYDGNRKKKTNSLDPKKANEVYTSYKGRLSEWLLIDQKERTHTLRSLFVGMSKSKKKISCLTIGCPVSLSTYNGMDYHLNKCGTPRQARKRYCPTCKQSMSADLFSAHVLEHSAQKDESHSKRKSAVKCAHNIANSFKAGEEDNSHEDNSYISTSTNLLSSPQKHTKSTKMQWRQTKLHPLCDEVLNDWRDQIKTAFESLRKKHFACDQQTAHFEDLTIESDFFLPLTEKQCASVLKMYEDQSVDFCLKKNERLSIPRFGCTLADEDQFVSYCGGPAICSAWCPTDNDTSDAANVQYLAVCTHFDRGLKSVYGSYDNLLQIWSLDTVNKKFELSLLLYHQYGLTLDVRWCPSGAYDQCPPSKSKIKDSQLRRLGILAIGTGIGDVVLLGIPHPHQISQNFNKKPKSLPIYKVSPLLVLKARLSQRAPNTLVFSLDWSLFNLHSRIVAGYSDGTILMWDLNQRSKQSKSARVLPPFSSMRVSKTPVRNVQFVTNSKVAAYSMEKTYGMWDVDERQCLYFTDHQVTSIFAKMCGPISTGYIFSHDCSLRKPTYPTYADFCHLLSIIVTRRHITLIWDIDVSPWHGTILEVDNGGYASLSTIQFCGSERFMCRRLMDITCLSTNVKNKKELEPKSLDYETVKENSILEFEMLKSAQKLTVKQNEILRLEADKKYQTLELDPTYPIEALFTASWNRNRNFSKWFACAGDSGLIFVQKMK